MEMSSESNRSGAGSSVSSGSSDRVPTQVKTYTIPDPQSVEEHGRSFTAYREGKYYLPNDGDEQDRLDIQHKLWELVMKGDLYWAPIGKPQNVLDIGTGTGIWAINFAKQHPQAKVTGTDLSLIQPVTAPSNCVFVREDCEEEWVFEHKFDFVHLRTMFTCFNDPRGVMQKIYDNLEPGGWVEYEDSALEFIGVDAEAEEYVRASPVAQWMDLMKRGLWNAVGRDIAVALKYKQWMAEIGFTDVVEKPVLCPVNSWPLDPVDREIGHFCRLDMERALDSTVKMLLAGGLTQEELPAFKESVRWSLGDRNLRGYFIDYVIYGRKPDLASGTTAVKQEEEIKEQFQTPLQHEKADHPDRVQHQAGW